MTTMTEIIQDRKWKEENPEFGQQEIVPQDQEEAGLDFHTMEFDFEPEISPIIKLRAKSEITGSTGLALWTCAQILSGYLVEHPHHVKNKRVLELGSGLGLVGIVAHHLGSERVIVTDGDLDVLSNLRYNMKQNQQQQQQVNDGNLSIHTPQLIWGENLDAFEEIYEKQSVILATDVFYSQHLVDPLWRTVDRLLEVDGVFILSFCPHNVTIHHVLDKAKELGFTWTCPNISDDDDDDYGNDDNDKQEEYIPNTTACSFGYFIFIFERKQ